MDDLISRQAAIDALDKRFDSIPMEQTTEILQLRKDLRKLPSAQPEPCEDTISRQWLMECVNEGWIKFDTEKDENGFIHLVRDIAPSAQSVAKDIYVPVKDCISRQEAIDAHYEYCNKHPDAGFPVWSLKILEDLPPAQPDLSEYSDKLWKAAYERGRAEALAEIVRCKDCKYYRKYGYVNGKPKFLPKCTFNSIYVNADDFCSRAERRTNDG